MALRDWSSAKVRLVMLAAASPLMLIMVVVGYADGPSDEDCGHAEQAMAHWLSVQLDTHRAMTGPAPTTLSTDAADAAAAVRQEATAIEDSGLRQTASTLANQLDQVSKGNHVRGYEGTAEAIQDLKTACPKAGDEPMLIP
ncbi:hypothetical protein [Mycolicibacterium peregrinum]|uniref:hypothetical protein n=1 Tax=Mycolicibacterium peregrinum TaxID=43304 RepID=UPI001042254B|nr:hypothetical protein [Mycolicibacterium peregrinum]